MTELICVDCEKENNIEADCRGKYTYTYFTTYVSADKNSFEDYMENDNNVSLLHEVNKKHSIGYLIDTVELMDQEEKDELLETFRLISRKNAIGVVSKGHGSLPISRKKKIGKIGILLQYENGEVKNIYPHEKNNMRIDIKSHLNAVIKSDDLDDVLNQECISEQDISRMISTFPELIEDGLEFIETEVEVESGRIDAVFKTKNDEHLLIEIEIEVNDNAIGQVQRFAKYSENKEIPRDKVRLGFVCAKISENILNACKDAKIEVYTLNLEKKA